MTAVVPATIRALPLDEIRNEELDEKLSWTYVQSRRMNFSEKVPGGVGKLMNAATEMAATPQIGRLRSEIDIQLIEVVRRVTR